MAELMSAALFAQRCIERWKAGDGYIMSAIGQDPKKLGSYYYNQYKNNDAQYKKALYWKEHAQRVWDCQGLSEGLYNDFAGTSINVRARNNYASWCGIKGTGLIPADRRTAGAAVFWSDGKAGDIHHVAYLVEPVDASKPQEDWYLIEARGVMYGVVRTKLLSRKPNFWGYMTKYFDYSGAEVTPDEDHGGQLLVVSGSWNVRTSPNTSATKMSIVKGGQYLKPVDTDWRPVWVGNGVGWISPKAVVTGTEELETPEENEAEARGETNG